LAEEDGKSDKRKGAVDKISKNVFNANVNQLGNCKKRIDSALQSMQEYISLSRKLSSVKAAVSAIPSTVDQNKTSSFNLNSNVAQMEDYEQVLKRFMREMNTNQTPQQKEPDLIPEVNWSLSELESIVYDFVNYNPKREKIHLNGTRFKL
tara:strand:- start:438 stop:887 length:450 start_codon:yes stop_codon:yes gene_type:complete